MRHQKSELWTKWRGLISEQSENGQTVSAFCHDRGLLDSLFYDWKKRLREADALQSGLDVVLNPKLLPREGARTAD
jgi:hypothetical protein